MPTTANGFGMMASLFDKMTSASGFSKADVDDFFAGIGDLSPGETGAILGYLLGRLDCEDAAAMVSAVRELHPQREVKTADGRTTVNLVGTGGGPSTFNITTTAAFVVAAAGAVVVKTGSAACRSKSGFADVAAKLGTMKLAMPWEQIESIANDVGIVFIPTVHYAPVLATLEDSLPTSTYRNAAGFLNKIGPLLSPVKVDYQFIGANSQPCMEMLSGACQILGDTPATVVWAEDGLDEVSSSARTHVVRLTNAGGRVDETIEPSAVDVQPPPPGALDGLEPTEAAACCERILAGHGTAAQTEIVALNAGVVLASLGRYSDWQAGFQAAAQLLKEGAGYAKLKALRERVWNV